MRWLNIIAGIAAVYLGFIWHFKGFEALPKFWVNVILAISLAETLFTGILASFGYKKDESNNLVKY